ncbi:MAG: site-2 protease family protein [Mariniblastus sp.]|nr:site-2 protease family protein [Mariniblastus sp.]
MDECVVLLAAKSFWLQPSNWWAIFQVLIGLGAVIFVHELGHFLMAKACGVKCDKFYVGFDVPIRLFGQTIIPGKLVSWKWGETEYGIGSIPLGGYVKMLGQDDNPGSLEEQVQGSMREGESGDSAILASGLIDRSKLDPRSYLAKSVLQRMLIISAGVIFNLVFAVFFAAWAFKSGVDYEPAVIGNVIGGGPAWQHDLTGAEVEMIGGKPVEGYFTYMDMAQEVVFNGDDREHPLEIKFKRYGEDTVTTASLVPQKGFIRQAQDLPLIGVSRRLTPVIGEMGVLKGNAADQANPPLKAGDRIIEVNGIPIGDDIELRQALARNADQVATFVVERDSKGDDSQTETITSEIPRNPMRQFGFSVQWLPIKAIKIGSPAEQAGLEVGDEIIGVDGQPRGDLITLDQRMIVAINAGKSVNLRVLRVDGAEEDLVISPVMPKLTPDLGPNQPLAVDSLGVAIPMSLTIESVDKGGPAAAAGLEVGDELISAEYLLSDEQAKDEAYASLRKRPVVNFVDDTTSWAEVSDLMQMMEAGSQVNFKIQRDSSEQTISIKTFASDQFFQGKRGISLTLMQRSYKSETWASALSYGVKQVREDAMRVVKTLAKLISGKISPTNLGGPGTIAMAATSEASRSTSRLLLFLTFLSANLAVVNFLPIPILDGGHMLFLAYEGIFRRPVSERVQVVLTYGGLFMILGLMLFVIFLDIGRIVSL